MDVSRDDKLQQLDKVLQSRVLHGSESLKNFLKYVVENTVDHSEVFLKEYTIATEVFGRDRSYDSRNDSVVRVQAGRLRTKLHEYYTQEGINDKVVIDLPKGHYTPVFSYNPHANGGLSGAKLSGIASPGETTDRSGAKWWRLATGALFLVCLGLGILVLTYRLGLGRQNTLSIKAAADAAGSQSAAPLWDDLLHSNQPVLVAFSNTRFQGTAETGMKLIKPLTTPERGADAYAGGRATDDGEIITEHYTGVGEVMGVYALSDLFCRCGHSFRLKRSLLLNWEDLKTENIVILGSPAENILIRDLPQAQDFVFGLVGESQGTAFGLSNTRPQAGEQKTYLAKQEGPSRSQISEDYALISLLRGLESERRLLILAGITTFGTQAAAEYVTKPEYIKDLIDHLNIAAAGQPPKLPSYYQVVVKVKVNGGVPVQIFYVTHHVLQ